MAEKELALVVGVGDGLSASVARLFKSDGMDVALAARNPDKLGGLAAEIGAKTFGCDASDPAAVDAMFADLSRDLGTPDIVVYNPSYRTRGAFTELDPVEVQKALMVTCYGGFLVGQAAAKAMVARGSGSIFFTGASASVKGYAQSAPFAMGKFGLRGLAQSMARELHPANIHVAHFVIDGGIADDKKPQRDAPDAWLEPDAIAQSYLDLHRQHRSAWSWEIELRPWVEKF
jgi:NAD(P)-dependent dehydrogenase (short-subunit alcohol dehydrogenase family)